MTSDLNFTKDGLQYVAGKGYMQVYKNGKMVFCALDIFKKKPTKEDVVAFYNGIKNIDTNKVEAENDRRNF